MLVRGCCWHHKGTIFQANHNIYEPFNCTRYVVVDTTKVRFFKQITTVFGALLVSLGLLLTPQRYDFSSKSQQVSIGGFILVCCCWHHKGTIFQANHNGYTCCFCIKEVVVDTTKVRFFKQITTITQEYRIENTLLLTPQRYDFSSKSQLVLIRLISVSSCCWHHKGTIFQANHNIRT